MNEAKKTKGVSERQRYWVEHVRRASEKQSSLAQYAREQGYAGKDWQVRQG